MIPDRDALTTRFGTWLMEQPETQENKLAATDLVNIMGNIVMLLRQTFKAIEVPHLMTYLALKAENHIRKDGGLYLYNLEGDKFRIQLAEEHDDDVLLDFLYSDAPDDLSGLEEK